MDVWWNNHFSCKDLESSNWNNHFKVDVSGSRKMFPVDSHVSYRHYHYTLGVAPRIPSGKKATLKYTAAESAIPEFTYHPLWKKNRNEK